MLCDLGGAAPLSTRVHMHACMHSHCFQLQTSDFYRERPSSKCRWLYSSKRSCAEWNNMLYFTRGVNVGALTKVCNLLKYIISVPICHTHICTVQILKYWTVLFFLLAKKYLQKETANFCWSGFFLPGWRQGWWL